jgi:hypothetical protein
MTILQRYQNRFDVLHQYSSLVAICKSQKAAQAFITGWRPATPERDEAYRKHEAWRPAHRRSS